MKRSFGYKIRFADIALLALGFGLALFDMTVLQKGIRLITGTNAANASLTALAIATIANSFALDWGMTNGKAKANSIFNKQSRLSFIAWVAFGFGYAIIEGITTIDAINRNGVESINWPIQIGQYLILLLSYVFSGLIIEKSSREICEADAFACRDSENEYKKIHKRLARDEARIKSLLTTLENYGQNFDALEEQYQIQLESIKHADESVMNEIEGKTLQANKEVTPSKARKILEDIRREYIK